MKSKARRSIDETAGGKILLLANLLTRSAVRRYRRLLGLSQTEWRIVAILGARPPMTLNQMATRAGRAKSQLSRGVSGLVRRKLVSRTGDDSDGRSALLSLAPKGQAAYKVLIRSAAERNDFLLNGLSASDKAALLRMLDHVIERARLLAKER